ncbi:MAG TPA: hypothetical protein VNB22_02395 [Pyrinomonadaceae bacterium]|jgi:hypothetical protein|nr:hypothetical protein [Pyrinomonadaceae bacterium]
MKKILLLITISAFGLGMLGCSFSASTGTNSTNTAKPANTASNAASNTASNSNSAKKPEAPKAKLADEKKPTDSKAKTAKNNPVPDSWIYVYDEARGYGFSVPEGTTGGSQTLEGIDVFAATTPAPNEISIFVLAYKDKTLTKEDLLDHAVKFLEGLGVKVTPGKLKGESDDYAVADAETVDKDGNKEKQRILVGTDVSDNYVMILNAPEAKFAADEKTIDEIWGSFEMWSGGASNN